MQHKNEGVLSWHRDSLGLLVQRFFFTILVFLGITIFEGCVNSSAINMQVCLHRSLWPLILTIVFIFLKVFCLRD
jgi:hypothetical protein